MLLDRISKEPTDHTRITTDMTWWLDPGETITSIVSSEVIQGMAGWSEAPYPPPGSPPPYDPTPVIMSSAALDGTHKQLIVFVQFGTAGVAYTLQFVLLGTSTRQITIELGVQVTGVPPEEPLPLPPPPSEGAGSGATAAYLNIEGGTMQGPLYLSQDPVYPTEAATKAYVDAHAGGGGGVLEDRAIISSTPPVGASPGALWWDNIGGQLYIYYDSYWVVVSNTG